jgi:hypothetical protein
MSAKKEPAKKTAAKAAPKADERRPDTNLPPTAEQINDATNDRLYLIGMLDSFTANLRSLDRQRHRAVGLRRLGFIEAALRIAEKFPSTIRTD